MPVYQYKGRAGDGKAVSGTQEAGSASEVAVLLGRQGIYVTDIIEGGARGPGNLNFSFSFLKERLNQGSPKVKLEELARFSRELSTLINAGITLISSLNISLEQTDSKALKNALAGVVKRLEEGNPLADSLSNYPQIFPEIFISMVEAGELGGVLDEVLNRLSEHLEREHEIKEKVKSAMTYPVMVIAFALVAVLVLMTFVLPKLINVIIGMGVPLPLPTRILMAVSNWSVQYWYLIPVLIFIIGISLKSIKANPRGRELLDKLTLKVPIFGGIIKKVIITRFCRTLGTLLKGGVPIIHALEVVKKASGNSMISAAVTEAQERVRNGEELSKPLESCGVFPPMVTKMIAVGEETGALDTLLERVGGYYEKEVNIVVGRLSSILEPVLIVFLGVVIGFIILSVMLPMISSMTKGLS
jgi:type IV pilus assembly protein PilC